MKLISVRGGLSQVETSFVMAGEFPKLCWAAAVEESRSFVSAIHIESTPRINRHRDCDCPHGWLGWIVWATFVSDAVSRFYRE